MIILHFVYTVVAIVEVQTENKQMSNECLLQWEISSIYIPVTPGLSSVPCI